MTNGFGSGSGRPKNKVQLDLKEFENCLVCNRKLEEKTPFFHAAKSKNLEQFSSRFPECQIVEMQLIDEVFESRLCYREM
jgi:hypothetical protein